MNQPLRRRPIPTTESLRSRIIQLYNDNYKIKAIAELTGRPQGTCATVIFRARMDGVVVPRRAFGKDVEREK